MFVYKTDKYEFLQKCKIRLVVCRNQQTLENLLTRAMTLISMTFQALMTITAKFDLKMIQMNVMNVFMNSKLNEMIYMKQSSEFENDNRVLQLRKTLYELRKFSLL